MASTAPRELTLREKIGAVTPAESVKYLNMLIYGEPGVGKTYFLGTAQDHEDTSPILILDIEGGVTTLRHRDDIEVKQIRSIKELDELYQELRNDTTGYYKTIAVDSLTELQKLDMQVIMRAAYEKNPDRVDIEVPSQREWGKSNEHIRKIVRAFRDLPCNTIFTCLSVVDKDDGGTNIHYPDLPGKLKIHIPGFMDVVGYLQAIEEKGEISRLIQFAKTRRVIAKDRTAALGDIVESPSIPLLMEKISMNGKGE